MALARPLWRSQNHSIMPGHAALGERCYATLANLRQRHCHNRVAPENHRPDREAAGTQFELSYLCAGVRIALRAYIAVQDKQELGKHTRLCCHWSVQAGACDLRALL
jgi:hypothetical protein